MLNLSIGREIKTAIIIIFSLTSSGCIAFGSLKYDETLTIDRLKPKTPAKIYYTYFNGKEPFKKNYDFNRYKHKSGELDFTRVFKNHNMDAVRVNESSELVHKYYLDLFMRDNNSGFVNSVETVTQGLAYLTVAIFPGYIQKRTTLEASVKKGDEVIKTYVLRRKGHAVIWLPFFVFAEFFTDALDYDWEADLVLELVDRLEEDGYLDKLLYKSE